MRDDQQRFLNLLGQLPARLTAEQTAWVLNCQAHDVPVLVGTFGGVPAGYAVAHVEPLRDGTLLGVLTDVYVEAGVREVGVGEALMEEVVRWAEARGCRGLDALVLPGNRATKNFFERFGLVARAIVVHRPLGEGGA